MAPRKTNKAKKPTETMQQRQRRLLQEQRAAKAQAKPTPAKPKATTAKPKPAAKPPVKDGRQPRALTNTKSATMRQIRAKAVQARRQAQGRSTVASRQQGISPESSRGQRIKQMARSQRVIGDSGQVRAAQKQGQQIRKAAESKRGAKQAMQRMSRKLSTAARVGRDAGRLKSLANPLTAAVAGTAALAKYGVSKGEVKRTKGAMQGKQTNLPGGTSTAKQQRASRAKAAEAGSTSKFKGARDVAMKKASAIKGSPVVGPKKSTASSFDAAFAKARSSGAKTFTWRGKKYTTKKKGE